MDVFSFISSIFKPASDIVDHLVTNDEERGQIKIELTRAQNEMTSKYLDYESKLMHAQSEIIKSEATGQSWLQRNWRPLMMVFFAVLLGAYWFGVMPPNMTQETINNLFSLLQIGIGGYIGGRSLEKIVPKITEALKK